MAIFMALTQLFRMIQARHTILTNLRMRPFRFTPFAVLPEVSNGVKEPAGITEDAAEVRKLVDGRVREWFDEADADGDKAWLWGARGTDQADEYRRATRRGRLQRFPFLGCPTVTGGFVRGARGDAARAASTGERGARGMRLAGDMIPRPRAARSHSRIEI